MPSQTYTVLDQKRPLFSQDSPETPFKIAKGKRRHVPQPARFGSIKGLFMGLSLCDMSENQPKKTTVGARMLWHRRYQ